MKIGDLVYEWSGAYDLDDEMRSHLKVGIIVDSSADFTHTGDHRPISYKVQWADEFEKGVYWYSETLLSKVETP